MPKTTLILYVIRHADAVPAGGAVTSDADRVLSPRGEEDARLMGSMLARMTPAPGLVITSPLRRARQTGELVASALTNAPAVRTSENLLPGFRPKALFEELRGLSPGTCPAVVGHQPDMSAFLAYLVAGSSQAAVAMAPGAVARIAAELFGARFDAQLQWLLVPDVVRSLQTV